MKGWTQAQIDIVMEVLIPVINGLGHHTPITLYDCDSGMVIVKVSNELDLCILCYKYDRMQGYRIKDSKKCAYWRWRSYPTVFDIITELQKQCPDIFQLIINYPK